MLLTYSKIDENKPVREFFRRLEIECWQDLQNVYFCRFPERLTCLGDIYFKNYNVKSSSIELDIKYPFNSLRKAKIKMNQMNKMID
jgi:hypothetical protein